MPSGGKPTLFGDKCRDCGVELTISNGILNRHVVKTRCRECNNIHNKSIPSRANGARKDQYIQWKYGITLKEYEEKLKEQNNKCAICSEPCISGRELAIDHDHKSGVIRALLCIKCNGILGLSNDNIELLIRIIEYIKKYNNEINN